MQIRQENFNAISDEFGRNVMFHFLVVPQSKRNVSLKFEFWRVGLQCRIRTFLHGRLALTLPPPALGIVTATVGLVLLVCPLCQITTLVFEVVHKLAW